MKTKTATLRAGTSFKVYLAVAATALALLAIPHAGHAQGVFRGAEQGGREGVREGGRAAGPVGAVVGGAIGTGVGAAVAGARGRVGFECGAPPPPPFPPPRHFPSLPAASPLVG